jgi:hypothetical protein
VQGKQEGATDGPEEYDENAEMEEGEDNEEQMLDIAEHCFYRVAQEIVKRSINVRIAF